jgi:hypothetical protein
MEQEGEPLPLLLSRYRNLPLYEDSFPKRHAYDRHYDRNHLIPDEFLNILADECYGGTLPCKTC